MFLIILLWLSFCKLFNAIDPKGAETTWKLIEARTQIIDLSTLFCSWSKELDSLVDHLSQ